MKVNQDTTLQNYLELVNFKKNGDRFEKEYGDFISINFPNCERFWREFVVPLTERMDGYLNKVALNINMRQSIDPRVEDIANLHYSMFMNLIFAHLHLETKMLPSLENIYAHLGSVCDLAEMVLEKWYFLLLQCQGKETRVLQRLSREEFLEEIAGKWYDEKYSSTYEYYLAKGKNPPVKFPSREDILEEYYGKESPQRKEYARHSQAVRTMRNVIVHNVRFARIDGRDGQILIPKPKVISRYKSWRAAENIVGNEKIIERDFAEQFQQAKEDIDSLEKVLDKMWEKLITDFREEFYSEERSVLRDLFNIKFSLEGPMILDIANWEVVAKAESISASGIYQYNGGTAEFRSKSDEKSE